MKHYKNLGFRITPAYAGKSKCRDDVRTLRKDHPRLCGEKHQGLCPRSRSYGITPAYAGKSISAKNTSPRFKDHPRLCGEKHLMKSCVTAGEGSPPPMRGKATFAGCNGYNPGITPAYAGKSFEPIGSLVQTAGSPPPMRGKASKHAFDVFPNWITPAYAGKSTKNSCCSSMSEDHPRLCGEKTEILFTHGCHLGSPPPMRGKVSSVRNTSTQSGITPAYAGKSNLLSAICDGLEDHPRLCGEK